MTKKFPWLAIVLVIIVIAIIVESFVTQTPTNGKDCISNEDCVVFGETGDCNCGCFNKNYQWTSAGACFCAAPTSCKCVNGKCEGIFVELEQACIDSGGTVKTSLCCLTTDDFPNMCLVGPCGCSQANSHNVKICDCGEGKCWDTNRAECISV